MTSSALIVGAGTAGCILARRLVDAGLEVTLVEAGGYDDNEAIHDPSRASELWDGPEDWGYRTVPQLAAGNRRLHLPRGKVTGGSHALNAMIWVRGAAVDFDRWAADGATGWAWSDVEPVYAQMENDCLPVTDDYPLSPIQESIMQAAESYGLQRNPNYNSGLLDGVSQEQVTIRNGRRANTWTEYVRPITDAPNLTMRVTSEVHSVIIDEGRAIGVRLGNDGKTEDLYADEIILAAGAIGSPAILLRSGIGPGSSLESIGVELTHEAPGVGANLHDHLLSPVIFVTDPPVTAPQQGISVSQTHLFWRSRPGLAAPDTQPIHFSVPMWGELEPRGDSGFSLMAGLVDPLSRGSLTLSGPRADDPVMIDLNALAEDADVTTLAASVRQCRAIGAEPPLAEVWRAEEVYPGPGVAEGDVEEWVRQTAVTYHHQAGTCRMGSDPSAVVDPHLKVNGIDHLRVVDASVIPRVPSGNTNAPVAMIAERAAGFLLSSIAAEGVDRS